MLNQILYIQLYRLLDNIYQQHYPNINRGWVHLVDYMVKCRNNFVMRKYFQYSPLNPENMISDKISEFWAFTEPNR